MNEISLNRLSTITRSSNNRIYERWTKRTVCRGGGGENLYKRFGVQVDKSGHAGTRKCKRGCCPMIGRRLSINRTGWMIGGGFDVLSSYH